MNKILYILRGVPGCGKTTLAKELTKTKGVMVSADDFMGKDFDPAKLQDCHSRCRDFARSAMLLGISPVVIHNTNTQEWEFAPYEVMAEENGYHVFHLIVENRHGNASVHDVNYKTYRKMKQRFEIELVPKHLLKKNDLKPMFDYSPLADDLLSLHGTLEMMKQVPQRKDYHPEGNVYNHTALVVGYIMSTHYGAEDAIILMYAGLFHDLGKYETTAHKFDKRSPDGRLVAYGHEKVSVKYVEKYEDFLASEGLSYEDIDTIKFIVKNHMRVKLLDQMRESKREVLIGHKDFPLLQAFAHHDNAKKINENYTNRERERLINIAESWFKELNEKVEA